MDPLSKILEAVSFKGVVYQKRILPAPWGIEMPQDGNSQFWRVLKGRCVLQIGLLERIQLCEGDIVFIPHGGAHWIADDARSRRVSAAAYVKSVQAGKNIFSGSGKKTIFVGGHFEFAAHLQHPFLRDLPPFVHLKAKDHQGHPWLEQIAKLIFQEVSDELPGGKVLISHLTNVLFVYIIRAYLQKAGDHDGFLLALNDDRISKALQLLQDKPELDWTLPLLARELGMSRTLFFNEFKRLVGETPLVYLTNWRMVRAKQLLQTTRENISEIAMQVGYQSEAAFNRAFKAKVNQTPANYRREMLAK